MTKEYKFSFGNKYLPVFVFLSICTIFGVFIGIQYKGSVSEEINKNASASQVNILE